MHTDAGDQLIFLALCVLEEAATRLQYQGLQLPPQPGVRLALGYLYSASREPRARECYDEFWRVLTGAANMGVGKEGFRSTWARTQLASIWRSVGVPQSIEMTNAVSRTLRNDGPTAACRARFADAVRQAGAATRAEHSAQIDANSCAPDRPGRKH